MVMRATDGRPALGPCSRPILVAGFTVLALLLAGCAIQEGQPRELPDALSLTILHTSDWHSRLLPYDMDVVRTDQNLGLLPENAPFGGVARLAHVIERERANAGRSIYLDSGDCFQGAPIFNLFRGEVEIRAMSLLRPDGVALGNHEFDEGTARLVEVLHEFGDFPMLAANYRYRPPTRDPRDPEGPWLDHVLRPFNVVEKDGLRIAIIGVGNFSSLSSITFGDNSMGIVPINTVEAVQQYADLLRPTVDLVVVTSHAGLAEDEFLIRNTRGIDVVMGGHLHVILDPPRVIEDAEGEPVVLSHGGAFTKYVGRLDLAIERSPDPIRPFRVVSHTYRAIPIDSRLPEWTPMVRLLEPYVMEMARTLDLTRIIAYAPQRVMRFGASGGDSPLGNIVSDSIRFRNRVETQFAATNSLGIRADMPQGPVTLEQMYNVFPFPNSITTLKMSGNEVQEFLNVNARRSSGRGCATQLQVSGISFTMDCSVSPAVATDILIDGESLYANRFYTLATNDYISRGGSGFRLLQFNNTQQDTGVPIRDSTIDYMNQFPSCLSRCSDRGLDEDTCPLLADCRRDLAAYNGRVCDGFEPLGDREHCIRDQAPRCLSAEFSSESLLERCIRTAADAAEGCDGLFRRADREACVERARDAVLDSGVCDGRDPVSPREACARERGAEACLALAAESPRDRCRRRAADDAEEICLTVPCLVGESEGRISRRLPTNKSLWELEHQGGMDAAEFMDWIQAEYNDEACY
ncbi:MAG: bifunctional metallophosphatase/5'-nucleotidase [Deltaproteobacteria bacterium]|nr:MAG: bifunctional metallophosphatase/5'-nucleotidase [Deltaproteobacteria bacterium]